MLLEVVDLALGTVIGSLFILNSRRISFRVNELVRDFTIKFVEEYLVWFMGWPAGLKLNNNLSKFFGEMLLFLMGLWTGTKASSLIKLFTGLA